MTELDLDAIEAEAEFGNLSDPERAPQVKALIALCREQREVIKAQARQIAIMRTPYTSSRPGSARRTSESELGLETQQAGENE